MKSLTFVRKDTAFYCTQLGGLPVFARVFSSFSNDEGEHVLYEVGFPQRNKKGCFDFVQPTPGTYVKKLSDFLDKFSLDVFDDHKKYLEA